MDANGDQKHLSKRKVRLVKSMAPLMSLKYVYLVLFYMLPRLLLIKNWESNVACRKMTLFADFAISLG